MLLTISHETVYEYDRPVTLGLQQIRQTPASNHVQNVVEWETTIEGAKHEVGFTDQYRNQVQLVSFSDNQDRVSLTSRGIVETTNTGGIFGTTGEVVPLWIFRQSTPLTAAGSNVRNLAGSQPADLSNVDWLHQLAEKTRAEVAYETGSSTSLSTAEDALSHGAGVCQDHAHIFVSAARLAGWPARYVSGYLMMNDRIDQEASHAWAEAYVTNLGWVGFDVSNGICPDERYVRVAVGLDYSEAAPVSGIRYGDAAEQLSVSIQVQQ